MTDELESYEANDAQEILRLFGKLSPPAEGPVPPAFRARVLARIAQRQQPWWRRLARMPIWAPVLVSCLLLSVSINVWWGSRAWDTPPAVLVPVDPDAKSFVAPPAAAPRSRRHAVLLGSLVLSVGLNVWLGYRLWKMRQ